MYPICDIVTWLTFWSVKISGDLGQEDIPNWTEAFKDRVCVCVFDVLICCYLLQITVLSCMDYLDYSNLLQR